MKDSRRGYHREYYLQSKRPSCFTDITPDLPSNVILVTTLESNRDAGYELVSKAPPPSERYRQFRALRHSRKVLTVEPIMEFDHADFLRWILDLRPECVWLGFNSRPASVRLPEPSEASVQRLVDALVANGIKVRGKTLRGVRVPPTATGESCNEGGRS